MNIKVVCSERSCKEWATAFVSKYECPKPAPQPDPEAPYDKPGPTPWSLEQALGLDPPPFSLWYACQAHRQACHKDLVGRIPIGIATVSDGNLVPGVVKVLPPVCERCGEDRMVYWESSRTAYHEEVNAWTIILDNIDAAPPSPNRPSALCRDCAADHHSYWDEMWSSYYGSQ